MSGNGEKPPNVAIIKQPRRSNPPPFYTLLPPPRANQKLADWVAVLPCVLCLWSPSKTKQWGQPQPTQSKAWLPTSFLSIWIHFPEEMVLKWVVRASGQPRGNFSIHMWLKHSAFASLKQNWSNMGNSGRKTTKNEENNKNVKHAQRHN